jgi:hypothetical protein
MACWLPPKSMAYLFRGISRLLVLTMMLLRRIRARR